VSAGGARATSLAPLAAWAAYRRAMHCPTGPTPNTEAWRHSGTCDVLFATRNIVGYLQALSCCACNRELKHEPTLVSERPFHCLFSSDSSRVFFFQTMFLLIRVCYRASLRQVSQGLFLLHRGVEACIDHEHDVPEGRFLHRTRIKAGRLQNRPHKDIPI
jgi:hypothetical protein